MPQDMQALTPACGLLPPPAEKALHGRFIVALTPYVDASTFIAQPASIDSLWAANLHQRHSDKLQV